MQYSDQVKFESVATEGQFLHCSKKTFGDVKIKANKKWFVAFSVLPGHFMKKNPERKNVISGEAQNPEFNIAFCS